MEDLILSNAIRIPFVKKVEPLSGSIFGGTFLKISGNGFSSKMKVVLGTSMCEIINNTLNTFICKTSPASSPGIKNIKIMYKKFFEMHNENT